MTVSGVLQVYSVFLIVTFVIAKRNRRVSESGHHSKIPRPQASQPGGDDTGTRSPISAMHGLSRKASTGSLSSLGGDTSSQPSSVGSQAEC
jgi:hypothetical protein